MRSARLPSAGLALAAAVLGAGAALASEESPKAKRVCIKTREINVITALDEEHVLVKLSAGRHYMFTVDKVCQGLKLARKIAISDATRVCNDGLTLISFEYPTVGPITCRIEMLDSVRDKDDALDLIASRVPPR